MILFSRNTPPGVTVILPQLLIGEYPTAADAEWLRATHQISAVVSLQDDADLMSKGLSLEELERAYERHGLVFHRVPVPDGSAQVLAARLDQIVTLVGRLTAHGHRVYLHCNAGMNRAPTVAIAYLHAVHGWSLSAAREFVKDRRHCVPYMQLLEARYARGSVARGT
jgi:protein-tyrosine phosphatase